LVFLATVTELPEIVTTLTAAIAGNARFVLGNMFGGIAMQTAILAVVDLFFCTLRTDQLATQTHPRA
jgi:cation:H+ antiporter